MGTRVCQSISEASTVIENQKDVVIQRYVNAREISVDALIAASGKCVVCVQRVRDKVVAGEVYRSHTVNIPQIRELALRTLSVLARRGLRGPLNIQIFDSTPPCLIEVNTRLGSGSVFSNIACAGRLFRSVLSEACGTCVDGDPDDYIVNLSLYRFLGEVVYQDSKIMKVLP
jgi:D-alanine-D-alanine ligase-like ATP-grasp enzyme